MCWLIFVAVSNYPGDVAALFRKQGLVPEPTANPVVGLMPANAAKLAISDRHCACSIYPDARRAKPESAAGLRQRYRRNGWTGAKIARAVQARLESNVRNSRKRAEHDGFPTVISNRVAAGARVSLLAHFFRSSFDPPFEVARRERLGFADFLRNAGAFAADTLVTLES